MLGKLIKYDFKALSRDFIFFNIMLLITEALGRFLFIGKLVDNPNSLSDSGAIIMTIAIMLYVILFMTAVFGTLLVIAIHFYKNLYSDEGYLTHTLPVSRTQLLISKTVSGSVWMMIDMILVILIVLVLVIYKPMIREFAVHKGVYRFVCDFSHCKCNDNLCVHHNRPVIFKSQSAGFNCFLLWNKYNYQYYQ